MFTTRQMCLTELCHLYLEYSKVYKKSYRTDCSKISRYIIPLLGEIKLAEVNRNDIRRYICELVNLKSSTKNRHLALIKAIMTFAVEYGYINTSPAAGIKSFNEPGSLRRAMEPDEFSMFIKVLQSEALTENRDTLKLLLLLAFTGMRLGEARSARIEDINFAKKLLHLKDSKAGCDRLVPLCGEAMEVIMAQREIYGQKGLIFRSRTGGMVTEPRRLMAALCKKAGIDKFTIHEIRYTAGSAMLAATRDIYAVKRFLGHKNIKTTERYVQYFGGQQHEDIEKAMALMLRR